jgi:hypothetical protein
MSRKDRSLQADLLSTVEGIHHSMALLQLAEVCGIE